MYSRYLNLREELEMSLFLFGARQTGKSTLLHQSFPKAMYIDLLDSEVCRAYKNHPSRLYDQLINLPADSIVIIDEITEVPELLNEIHRLMFATSIRFIICASSARKLRRKGYNTLGGRAFPCYLYPLVSQEIPNLDIDQAVTRGLLPAIYGSKIYRKHLASYIDVYLREEIKAEAIVRDLAAFERFLEVAAMTDGEIVNYSNIANDCNVKSVTIKEYFSILEDTLIGYMIPAYTKTTKRRVVQAPKFYYFDVGVANHLLHRHELVRGTQEYGHAFEHFVMQELIAYIGYTHHEHKLSYWHTYTGQEVDAIIDNRLAIEIKSCNDIQSKHLKGLKAFNEEQAGFRLMVVSLDPITRKNGDIEIVYVKDFLQMLWNGELTIDN